MMKRDVLSAGVVLALITIGVLNLIKTSEMNAKLDKIQHNSNPSVDYGFQLRDLDSDNDDIRSSLEDIQSSIDFLSADLDNIYDIVY